MNHIVRSTPHAVSAAEVLPPTPEMSPALAVEMARLTEANPEVRALVRFDPALVSDKVRQEARDAAIALEAHLKPARLEDVARWLGGVNAGCRNPQNETDLRVRLNIIIEDCGHFPRGCFTPEGRRALSAITPFFPSTGDVLAALEPIEQRLRAQCEALERIATEPPAPSSHTLSREKPTDEQRAANAAKLKQLKDEASARAERRPTTTRPGHLPDHLLLASYEKEVERGGPTARLAQTRVAMLRQKLGPDQPAEKPEGTNNSGTLGSANPGRANSSKRKEQSGE